MLHLRDVYVLVLECNGPVWLPTTIGCIGRLKPLEYAYPYSIDSICAEKKEEYTCSEFNINEMNTTNNPGWTFIPTTLPNTTP